jgi:hypothetical protein
VFRTADPKVRLYDGELRNVRLVAAVAVFAGATLVAWPVLAQEPQPAQAGVPADPPAATPAPATGQGEPAEPPAATPAPATGQGEPVEPPAATPAPASGQGQPETPQPEGFRIGDFRFKPSGRVKLDVIRDFNAIGSEDSFDTRTILVDGTESTNSNIHAKETRLNLDIRGMVQQRELRMFIETDFYGTSSALRLRHAYGTWGGLLAGQTWTTFMDDDNLPRTIDFESPTAFAQIRQAQVRWTQKLGEVVTWSAAMEDNKSSIVVPTGIPGKAEYPIPDFVTRFVFGIPRGHVATSAFVGAARFRPIEGDPDSETLWGTMGSVKYSPFGTDSAFAKDSVYGVFTIGDGIGRYRGGTTAVPDENGELHAVGGIAFMGGYEHFWTSRWSTNAVYSIGHTDDEPFYTSAVNRELQYGAVNLLYWFLGDRAWTGVEYLYGYRQVYGSLGEGGDSGHANRLQYAVRFNLP